ncbi:MAG: thermonuclease family protein [Lentisphaerae bacterium]|jgi:endonuclease YncB( thermonuclease family)|nr:thermonuclease family protein [Lentisphaerota bacterium]
MIILATAIATALLALTAQAQYVLGPTSRWLELKAKITHYKDARTFRIVDERGIPHQLALGAIEPPNRGQRHFKEALERIKQLTEGKTILIKHRYFDQHGHLLGQLYVDDTWVNKSMAEEGWAWFSDTDDDAPELKQVVHNAKIEKRGLWKNPTPVPPWLHRRGKISYRPGMENEPPPKYRRYQSTNEPAGMTYGR